MAEYIYNEVQTIQAGGAAYLNDKIPCNARPQKVVHDAGSGILRLRGIVNNPCAQFARYRVTYGANIAVPEGGTPGEIQLAIASGGEILPTSISAATPTVAEAYWNVHGSATIDVPVGCCYSISIENASVSADPTTTPAPAVDVRNLNVEVMRQA